MDPWGSVVAQCGDIPHKDEGEFCLAEINLHGLASVRQGNPQSDLT